MYFLGLVFHYTHLEQKEFFELKKFFQQFCLEMRFLKKKGQLYFSREVKSNFIGGCVSMLVKNGQCWDLNDINRLKKSIRKELRHYNRLLFLGFLFYTKNEVVFIPPNEYNFNTDSSVFQFTSYGSMITHLTTYFFFFFKLIFNIRIQSLMLNNGVTRIQTFKLNKLRSKFF
uniref:Uncharacterized protein n=1 Tax=Pleurostomum flabellatum TaxID=405751 RepID=A0A7T0M421_9EUKA|nr:hypothetical protein J6731_mgp05 [Pleurostomum flabellatum]QPL15617.1 hypothetical protein [Pleurostomum flabellatum]